MGNQIITLAGLKKEYDEDREGFRDKALAFLLPSAVLGTAKACRGDPPFKVPQRWACLAGLKVAGWLDSRTELAVTLRVCQELGAKDLEHAKTEMERARRARSVTLEGAEARAVEILREIMRAKPERSAGILEALGAGR